MLLSHIQKVLNPPVFSLSILVSFVSLTSTFFLSANERCLAATYYVATNGNDSNSGSLFNPWKTIEKSIEKLQPGDTLYLRSGTYYESQIVINNHGEESNWITIKNYADESVTINGCYKEFRSTPNSQWEVYDSSKGIYRSVNTYPNAEGIHGYFGSKNGNYRLVSYERYSDLSADNENYTDIGNIYLGPGIFWDSSDERIYIRLKHSEQEIIMGYTIPLDTNPCSTLMHIFPNHEVITFQEKSSYIHIESINLRYQNNALEFKSGANHIFLKNIDIIGGRTPVLIRNGVHGIVFDGIHISGNVPPWIAWSDVKCGMEPGHAFQGPAISIQDSAYDIEIKNCTFEDTWDGIGAVDTSYNLHIHNNIFKGTRDDGVQLGSGCSDIEINHNKMIFVSKGISRHGSGSPPKPGTKYIHHNIIDCSKPMLGGRRDPDRLLSKKYRGPNGDGMVWARPLAKHEANRFGKGDPWKIYHNTLVFGKELNNKGTGHEYILKYFYRDQPQEVYNNIIIQTMDHWLARECRVADGSQIYDGNIYYRSINNPKTYFFKSHRERKKSSKKHFMSLSEFKSSRFFKSSKKYYPPGLENSGIEADPQLDKNYYPDPNGPAATGAIPLPSGWPGRDGKKYRGALPPQQP
ncbi:MAG: right-handed parallel beta-helix repeat-containing protein [Candidatus Jettenia sp.]|nr:MAG: right-handed parallel beta-helix repeat-containing protein [Candidatus Jettenia sp.]